MEHLHAELWYPCLSHTLLNTAQDPLRKRFSSYSSWSFEPQWVVFSGGSKQTQLSLASCNSHRLQKVRSRVFIKEPVEATLTHQFLYVTCCFALILPLVWTYLIIVSNTLMLPFLTYFFLFCLPTATLIRPPLGRILVRHCFRWTRLPRPVLCQSSNRTLWTQPVVCIHVFITFRFATEAARALCHR